MLKTVQVKYPPTNNPVTSEQDAISIRNQKLDELLQEALHSGRITASDIDEYNALYHKLVECDDPSERVEILQRLSEIDGSGDMAASSTVGK